MKVLVTKSINSSPQGRSLTIVASQEVKLSLFIVKTMFPGIGLSFLKLSKWSK